MISTIQAGIGINFIGFALDLIGVVTKHWLTYYHIHAGLFLVCTQGGCQAVTYHGAYKTMQGMASLGFLVLLVVTIMAAVYLCNATLRENIRYKKALGSLMIIGGLITFIGAMIGVGAGHYTASWSLGLAATGGVISFVSGILVLIPFFLSNNKRTTVLSPNEDFPRTRRSRQHKNNRTPRRTKAPNDYGNMQHFPLRIMT